MVKGSWTEDKALTPETPAPQGPSGRRSQQGHVEVSKGSVPSSECCPLFSRKSGRGMKTVATWAVRAQTVWEEEHEAVILVLPPQASQLLV